MLKEDPYVLEELLNKAKQALMEQGHSVKMALAMDWLQEMKQFAKGTRQDWALALCSNASDQILARFFNLKLVMLGTAVDNLYDHQRTEDIFFPGKPDSMLSIGMSVLYELISHLQTGFQKYFNAHQIIPRGYLLWKFPDIDSRCQELGKLLRKGSLAEELQGVLTAHFEQVPKQLHGHPSYQSVDYTVKVLTGLAQLLPATDNPKLSQELAQFLIRQNFNHLGFFAYLTRYHLMQSGKLPAERITYYQHQVYLFSVLKYTDVYDQLLPSIGQLMIGWFKEQVTAEIKRLKEVERKLAEDRKHKVHLNLPVTYVACLLKLFYEADLYNNVTLTDLFKFTAVHYQAKRQANMSSKSLAKEYYSIDQMTAARVKDLLQKFVSMINHHYFPVLAGACTIVYSY